MLTSYHAGYNRLLALEQELSAWQRSPQADQFIPHNWIEPESDNENAIWNEIWNEESWEAAWDEDWDEEVDEGGLNDRQIWSEENSIADFSQPLKEQSEWPDDDEIEEEETEHYLAEVVSFEKTGKAASQQGWKMSYGALAATLPDTAYRRMKQEAIQSPDLLDLPDLPSWSQETVSDWEPSAHSQTQQHHSTEFRPPNLQFPDPDPGWNTSSALSEESPSYHALSQMLQAVKPGHGSPHSWDDLTASLDFDPFPTIDVAAQTIVDAQVDPLDLQVDPQFASQPTNEPMTSNTDDDVDIDAEDTSLAISSNSPDDTLTADLWDHLTQSLSDLDDDPGSMADPS